MPFLKRIEKIFSPLVFPSSDDLLEAIQKLQAAETDAAPFVMNSENKPYGRKLIFKSDYVEILVMAWSQTLDCSPHDHGRSFGWVQVISGSSNHTLYKLQPGGLPVAVKKEIEKKGSLLHVGRGMIHKMGTYEKKPLITLHVYSPPISGMKVFDLEKCAACIVSEDCGAWWPDEQRQLLKTILLPPKHAKP
ncbi:cysteine dioxygenase [Fictibacillus terranigra]|uniref:Cysteine dioxygenase family protein n=1 Tax=Fictibacillus terranigra TaxID=3058424 RepID=A0ABT8E5M3_9BACL|nr:cysteine dioxygenase family protein [Fictibacillus sp. CENA-BCM004]MDN4073212.1 cysteine dioxygenase family protein [Fictibacillus sp. CENA-BCM004]